MTPPSARGPMPKRGNPQATTCRHCKNPKITINGFLFCELCDAPRDASNHIIRPTWKPRLA